VAERFAAAKAALARGDKYTPAGVQQALRESIPGYAAQLESARAPISKMKREAQERRAAMSIKAPDKGDLAGAMERAEIRTFLRSLGQTKCAGVLLSTTDKRLLEAALTAPPELSGLAGMEDVAAQIESRYVEMTHGPEAAAVDALESVVAEADAIARTARGKVQSESGMDSRTFDGIAGPAEKAAAPAWLIRSGDSVMVCEVAESGTAAYRPATLYEQQSGEYYENLAAYQASRGEAA
jgi:hypothetical protein